MLKKLVCFHIEIVYDISVQIFLLKIVQIKDEEFYHQKYLIFIRSLLIVLQIVKL